MGVRTAVYVEVFLGIEHAPSIRVTQQAGVTKLASRTKVEIVMPNPVTIDLMAPHSTS